MLSFWFAVPGVAFTFSEIMDRVFNQPDVYALLRSNFVLLLAATFLISICLNWQALKCSHFLAGTDIKITLLVRDILKQKDAVVISTNTTFDTLMDDEFISIKSVQGQFQEKYYHNNLGQLNKQLAEALDGKPYIDLTDGRQTNTKQYAIGTVCKISINAKHAYFSAVADINKFGKPINTKMNDIITALVNLWQSLNTIGHIEALSIPLIGTGRAGVKDASRDIIIQEIIFSFIVAAKEMKVTENLTICVHPSDFSQKNLHWEDMCEYLKYMCKFKHSARLDKVEGQPEK